MMLPGFGLDDLSAHIRKGDAGKRLVRERAPGDRALTSARACDLVDDSAAGHAEAFGDLGLIAFELCQRHGEHLTFEHVGQPRRHVGVAGSESPANRGARPGDGGLLRDTPHIPPEAAPAWMIRRARLLMLQWVHSRITAVMLRCRLHQARE